MLYMKCLRTNIKRKRCIVLHYTLHSLYTLKTSPSLNPHHLKFERYGMPERSFKRWLSTSLFRKITHGFYEKRYR